MQKVLIGVSKIFFSSMHTVVIFRVQDIGPSREKGESPIVWNTEQSTGSDFMASREASAVETVFGERLQKM